MEWVRKTYGVIFQFAQKHEKVFFFAVASWFCLEYYILGPFSYVRKGDNMDSVIPRASTLWDFVTFEGSSNWYHLLAGGVDRLANEIVAARLDSIFFLLFPGWLATALLLLLSTFIGGYFVYRICFEYLQLHRGASYMAGTFFSASLIFTDIIPIMIGLAIFPVALYYLEKLDGKSRWSLGKKYLVVVLLALLFGLSSSLILTLPFMLGGVLIWFGFIRKNLTPSFILILGIFAIVSFIPSINEIQSLLINAPLSQRGGDYYQNIDLLNYVVGVGSLVRENALWLVILLVGAMQKTKPALMIRLSFIALFFLFGTPGFIHIVQLLKPWIGFLSDFGFNRFDLLIPFFGILAATITVNHLQGSFSFTAKNGKSISFPVQSVIVTAIFVGILIGNLDLKINRTETWIKKGGYVASSYSQDLAYIKTMEQHESKGQPFRMAIITDRSTELIPTIAHFHGLETIGGHTNLTSKEFQEFFRIMGGDVRIRSSLYLLWEATRNERDRFFSNQSDIIDIELLSLANVKYIASAQPISHPNFKLLDTPYAQHEYKEWSQMKWKEKLLFRLEENFRGRKLLVYENTGVFPRFYLTNNARTFASEAELLETLSSASAEELKESVYLMEERVVSTPNEPRENVQQVTMKKYESNTIEVSTLSETESWLVVTNNYNPNWNAYINGEKTTIVPAYHTFMAIPLPIGENMVVLKYEPSYALFP